MQRSNMGVWDSQAWREIEESDWGWDEWDSRVWISSWTLVDHSGWEDSRMISHDTIVLLVMGGLSADGDIIPIVPVARAPARDSPRINLEVVSQITTE